MKSEFFPDGFLFPIPTQQTTSLAKLEVDSSDQYEIKKILYENYELPVGFYDFTVAQIDKSPEKYRVNVRARGTHGVIVLHSFVATKTSPGEYMFHPQLDKPRTVKVFRD